MPIKYQKQLEEAERKVKNAKTEDEKKEALVILDSLKIYVDAMVNNKQEMEYLS